MKKSPRTLRYNPDCDDCVVERIQRGMMAKTKTTKKRNPQDATLRNMRATAKRLAVLAARVEYLEHFRDAVYRVIEKASSTLR